MNHPDSKSSEFASRLPECDVLMQIDNMFEGGLENMVIDLALALEKWGYGVALLVLGDAGEGALKAVRSGLRVCVRPYNEEALSQELERVRPAMVLAHYSFQGARLYESLDIPFIQVLHSVYAWMDDANREMFAKAALRTTFFVAVSEAVKEYSVERLGVPAEKCPVIPNGIDLSKFTPEAKKEARALRLRLGFSDEDYLFVAVSSINRLKRILALVKSFRCIRDLAPRARLVLIGYPHDQGYLDELLAYIGKNDLADRVSYVGHSPTPELYYLMADAFAHASCVEGGQLTLLEALAADLPVVTTDVGFARHFAPYPGLRVIDRDFPYASFARPEALQPSPGLVADLAWAMLQTCRKGARPNLPPEVVAAFDATQTYRRYEQLIANRLKRPPRTEPAAEWVALLPEAPPASPVMPLSSDEGDAACAVRAMANYEAMAAEREAALAARLAEREALIQGLLHSSSWRVTAPLRAVSRLVRILSPRR